MMINYIEIGANKSSLSQELKLDFNSIADNETEIEDRFYQKLLFGSVGICGLIGAERVG